MNKFPVFCVMLHTARGKTDNKVVSLPIRYARNKKISSEAEPNAKEPELRTPRRKYLSIMISLHDANVSVKRCETHCGRWAISWKHVHETVKLAYPVAEHPFSKE